MTRSDDFKTFLSSGDVRVIVRCDDAEHLLLLGINQDIVIETNLDKSRLQIKGEA